MNLDEGAAATIIGAAHSAWSRGDLEGMLSWYCDDLTYFCNTGGPDGGALRLVGKSDLRAFLRPLLAVADCITTPATFTYRDGVGRAHIEVALRHLKSGHVLTGLYRQVIWFDGLQIAALEEFHDAARMRAFWAMVLLDDSDELQRVLQLPKEPHG